MQLLVFVVIIDGVITEIIREQIDPVGSIYRKAKLFTKIDVNFKEVDFIKTNFVTFYKSPFSNDFFAKIWQPPKIS